MDPVIVSLLTSWDIRPIFLVVLIFLGALYTIGWRRLRAKSRDKKLATRWKLIFYWGGLVAILLALMSPIDVMGSELFYMHMIQHLLMTMVAAPLLMLANPMPFILWGLPIAPRRRVGRFLSRILHRESTSRDWLRKLTGPGICYMIMLALLWGWHDANLYNLALASPFWHDLEHISFFWGAILYWWHATGAGPRVHPLMSRLARVGYLFAGIPTTMFLGIAISFSTNVIYTFYETRPRLPAPLDISVINDQILGGIIMWVPGSMMYFIGGLILIARWMQEEERKSAAKYHKVDSAKKLATP